MGERKSTEGVNLVPTKEKRQDRFAGAQKRANKRDRKADLDPEANPRDKRVVEHRAACVARRKWEEIVLGRDMTNELVMSRDNQAAPDHLGAEDYFSALFVPV